MLWRTRQWAQTITFVLVLCQPWQPSNNESAIAAICNRLNNCLYNGTHCKRRVANSFVGCKNLCNWLVYVVLTIGVWCDWTVLMSFIKRFIIGPPHDQVKIYCPEAFSISFSLYLIEWAPHNNSEFCQELDHVRHSSTNKQINK